MPDSDAPAVLIVDDDAPFARTLARALERRGWRSYLAHSAADAIAVARETAPDAAVVDLRIDTDDGLAIIAPLRKTRADMHIVVLTGYASIATAVRAIKLGADDYLAKPVTGAAVASALSRQPAEPAAGDGSPMSPRRMEWEYLQRMLAEHDGNVSATARALNMHRRTLQRKLAKRPAPR